MAVLTFIGAAQQVTGSCYLLESPAFGKILMDCGLHQGGDAVERMEGEGFPFDPSTVKALILSHAHLDHCGLIPALVNKGFSGVIYCTNATKKLLPVMLYDSAGLYERDLKYENLHRKRRGESALKPAYTKKDVKRSLSLIKSSSYKKEVEISADAHVKFHDAGHILGSAIIELCLKEKGQAKTLVFSGDLGKNNSVLMNDPATLESADIVLMESTYGNRNHRSMDGTLEQFETILKETWDKKGNVMIPAFAVGRTQEVLFHLGCLHREGKLAPWQVFLDSPMAIDITNIYDECLSLLDPEDTAKLGSDYQSSIKNFLPRINYTKSTEESMQINNIASGAIIIAGSGMCTGGRIRHHFKQRIWNQRNTVIFMGYQAMGTLGRKLVDGMKKIRLFRDEFVVKARIETLGGFSAHAGQTELVDWISHFKTAPRVMLIHGEPESLEALSAKLFDEKNINAEIPFIGQQITF